MLQSSKLFYTCEFFQDQSWMCSYISSVCPGRSLNIVISGVSSGTNLNIFVNLLCPLDQS
jgi:hypothetical protein